MGINAPTLFTATTVISSLILVSAEPSKSYELIAISILIGFFMVLWFLPALIARRRKHNQTTAIFVASLFGISWIAAIIWAFTEDNRMSDRERFADIT